MVITTLLAGLYLSRSHLLSTPLAVVVVLPVLAVELVFLTSNLAKVLDGGFVPLMIAAVLGLAMWSWWSGTQSILAKAHKQLVPLASFVKSMAHSSVHIVPGTAFFLSPDPDVVPSALLHNLKHNRILHEQTVIVTIETLRVPVAAPEERVQLDQLDDRFTRLTLRFGFMETPNVSRAMSQARRAGLRFDVMKSSFFLGRRRPVVAGPVGGKRLLDRCYALLTRFSADPTDFYHLPRDRVVELGERVAV